MWDNYGKEFRRIDLNTVSGSRFQIILGNMVNFMKYNLLIIIIVKPQTLSTPSLVIIIFTVILASDLNLISIKIIIPKFSLDFQRLFCQFLLNSDVLLIR